MADFTDEQLEKALDAAIDAIIVPTGPATGTKFEDYASFSEADAVDLGIKLGLDKNDLPRWHVYSDIRAMQMEDAFKAILKPMLLAALKSLGVT